jgi:hypothetical protein
MNTISEIKKLKECCKELKDRLEALEDWRAAEKQAESWARMEEISLR